MPAFYADCPGRALGVPVALNSLRTFDSTMVDSIHLDPDLRALASIADLCRRLDGAGIAYDARLFLTGVYRGAAWAHRFALLHPRFVRAVAPVCGNWYTMPYETLDGAPLPWPLGLADFDLLGRGAFDRSGFAETPYYVTLSARERVWYDEQSPEAQGADVVLLDLFADRFGSIPPERGESFVQAWIAEGFPFEFIWSEGGHGWIDAVRLRVFEFFAGFELSASP